MNQYKRKLFEIQKYFKIGRPSFYKKIKFAVSLQKWKVICPSFCRIHYKKKIRFMNTASDLKNKGPRRTINRVSSNTHNQYATHQEHQNILQADYRWCHKFETPSTNNKGKQKQSLILETLTNIKQDKRLEESNTQEPKSKMVSPEENPSGMIIITQD